MNNKLGSINPHNSFLMVLESAIKKLTEIEGIVNYIPQVGSNMVYAKENAKTVEDVAALCGRIIATAKGPLACGKVAYGASRYLSSVILVVQKFDCTLRSALNIKAGEDIIWRLRDSGLSVVTIPSTIKGEDCPIAQYVKDTHELADAYVHPGDFGVEPTITIVAETPERLVNIMMRITRFG